MRPMVRVVSMAVLLRSRRKAAQGMRAMAKDVALAQGSKDVASVVLLIFFSVVGEGFAPVASFWLAGISY